MACAGLEGPASFGIFCPRTWEWTVLGNGLSPIGSDMYLAIAVRSKAKPLVPLCCCVWRGSKVGEELG